MSNNLSNEQMFEFAMDCQRVLNNGWKFENIDYGEARLGIGPRLVVSKGDCVKVIYHFDDISQLLNKDP